MKTPPAKKLAKAARKYAPDSTKNGFDLRLAFKAGAAWALETISQDVLDLEDKLNNTKEQLEAIQYGEDL